MKGPSTELVELIQSMSRNEKSYFKNFTSSYVSEEKSYIKLFDAINKKNDISDAALKKHMGIRNLSRAKNYLHQSILKSLKSFYHRSSTEDIITEELQNIGILLKKLLLKQARKSIDRIKKIAEDLEFFGYFFEIIRWERKLYLATASSSEEIKINLERLQQDEIIQSQKQTNFIIYQELSTQVFYTLTHWGDIRNEETNTIYLNYLSHPLLQNEDTAKTLFSKISFHQTLHLIYKQLNLKNEELHHILNVIRLFESKPMLLKEKAIGYSNSIYNALNTLISLKKFNELEELYNKLISFQKRFPFQNNQDIEISFFQTIYTSKSNAAIKQGKVGEAIQIAKEIEVFLKKYNKKLQTIHELCFFINLSEAYFLAKEYRIALQWLNRVLQSNEIKLRQDLLVFARIFNLIIHFELGNIDLLPYIVKSTYRFLLKLQRLYKVETYILEFIRRDTEFAGEKQMKELFQLLLDRLKPLKEDPFEKMAFEEIDYVAWLESKIENTSYAEIVKRQSTKS